MGYPVTLVVDFDVLDAASLFIATDPFGQCIIGVPGFQLPGHRINLQYLAFYVNIGYLMLVAYSNKKAPIGLQAQ
jgi:hypothetical protein